MINGATVEAEVLLWVRTPFVPQASLRGVGCDCGGLVRGVAVAVGCTTQAAFNAAFAPFSGYASQPNGTLQAICDKFMERIDAIEIGCVVLMDYTIHDLPHHLGFIISYPGGGFQLVHAISSQRRVVAHRFSNEFKTKVVQAYRLPGVAPCSS